MDCSLLGSSVHGIFQARVLECGAIAFSIRNISSPGLSRHSASPVDLQISSSVTQSCLTLCDPTDCSTSGFHVLHYLSEFAQTHIQWVGEAIQPSHPLLSLSPALNLSSIRVFSNESALRIRWPKCWSFNFNISPSNEHPGLISFRMDWLDLLAV